MKKYSFKDDYSEGAHPEILRILTETNLTQTTGYGEDVFSDKARELIKKYTKNQEADIHFVTGGTQANLIAISSILKPHHSVIAAETAHIEVHEAGAVESTGHKINTIKTKDGKLNPGLIQKVLDNHIDEHMVKPKMVFISNSTETGLIYSLNELKELSGFCKNNNLYLYIDGARLASALTSEKNDLSLKDISELTDIFYIGGTKNGALLGEAIVINNNRLKEDFRFYMKQKGALLAKGRLIGIQFTALFNNGLYFELAKHANESAKKIAEALKKKGYEFMTEPVTNQIFPILPNKLIEKLHKKYDFYVWSEVDDEKSVVRIICSWATNEKYINAFIDEID